MTISATASSVTAQGDGSNKNWSYAFLIPDATDVVVTVTTIASGATQVIASTAYSITGINDSNGGIVTYPLSGSALSTLYNLTVQRVLPITQTTDLVNQDGFYPEVVEDAFDNAVMLIQQLQAEISLALAFPVGSNTDVPTLMAAILNGATNATAAAASATAAAASAASITALLPLAAANIATDAVTSVKIIANAVTPVKLATASIMQGAIILNGTVVESHAASAVTFALKTLAGTDPSATDPVYVCFRDSNIALGDFVVRTVTAALSLVVSSGSTLGSINATAFRLWLVLFDDAATVRLGIINCLSGTSIYPLGQNPIASSTAEGGAGGADSAQVFYTGTAVTSKAYVIIGHATYETGQTTAGTWAASPTKMRLHALGMPLPGASVQETSTYTGAVASGTTAIPDDDTIPQITEGDQYMSLAITPTSAANLLQCSSQGELTNGTGQITAACLFQDAVANALVAVRQQVVATGALALFQMDYTFLAALSVSTTLRFRGGATAGTTTFNGSGGARKLGGVLNSYMKLKEIMT